MTAPRRGTVHPDPDQGPTPSHRRAGGGRYPGERRGHARTRTALNRQANPHTSTVVPACAGKTEGVVGDDEGCVRFHAPLDPAALLRVT